MADESRISNAGSTESLSITKDSNANTIHNQDSKKRKFIEPRSMVGIILINLRKIGSVKRGIDIVSNLILLIHLGMEQQD